MKNITSLELKQLLKGDITNIDIASIFVTWAIKGFVSIDNNNEHYILTKKKDIPISERKYEVRLYNKLFNKYSRVDLSDLYGGMYIDFQKVYLGLKRELAKEQSLKNKLPLILLYILIAATYLSSMFLMTNNLITSLLIGTFYVLPHSFISYIIQSKFEGSLQRGNAIWAGIIFIAFTAIIFGINSLGSTSTFTPIITVLLATLLTVILGYKRSQLASKHSQYEDALSRYKFLVESLELSVIDLVDVILLQLRKEQLKLSITDYSWINITDKDQRFIQKIDKIIVELGNKLAPTPVPSGTIAASK